MALSDVTVEGLEHAIDEFEHLGKEDFLAQFGFGEALDYFLIGPTWAAPYVRSFRAHM